MLLNNTLGAPVLSTNALRTPKENLRHWTLARIARCVLARARRVGEFAATLSNHRTV